MLHWQAQEMILHKLDRDPKLAETDMNTRAELFKPLAMYRRLDFGVALIALFLNIEEGLQQNDLSFQDLQERYEPSRPEESPEKETPSEGLKEELRSFESDLDNLADDGSIVADIS